MSGLPRHLVVKEQTTITSLQAQRTIYRLGPKASNGVFTPEQDNDKRNVEPVHSYDAFHTRFVGPGVKGIIGMHRFNISLVVVLSLSCSGVKTPLVNSIRG